MQHGFSRQTFPVPLQSTPEEITSDVFFRLFSSDILDERESKKEDDFESSERTCKFDPTPTQ
jgi:hypothetical protein